MASATIEEYLEMIYRLDQTGGPVIGARLAEEVGVSAPTVKQTLKRRSPGFNESYYGFRSFNTLLEEAAKRRLIGLERDDKSGGYVIHSPAEAS